VRTGAVKAWNPDVFLGDPDTNLDIEVYALAVSRSRVYVSGDFFSIGGDNRDGLAAVNARTGATTAWNPECDNTVDALAVRGGTVYAGGYFDRIGGRRRHDLAALDARTGRATEWRPRIKSMSNIYDSVDALALSKSRLYVGGEFNRVDGRSRNYAASFDTRDGALTEWNPNAAQGAYFTRVETLAVAGSTVYAGGDFTSIGGKQRNDLAALRARTGAATAWNPGANDVVDALAVSRRSVYVGGDSITSIGGRTRDRLAAISVDTGTPTAWNPGANGAVDSLAVSGQTLYAGGNFTRIGARPRARLAAFALRSGATTGWRPTANGPVYTLASGEKTLYLGGVFTEVGGVQREHIAAVTAGAGSITSWNPAANRSVYALAVSRSLVYVGGVFTTVGGRHRDYIAALGARTGTPTPWNVHASYADCRSGGSFCPDFRPGVYAMVVSGRTLYVGGSFDKIGHRDRGYLAALRTRSGVAVHWDPEPDGPVLALAVSKSIVYTGGEFSMISGHFLSSEGGIAALRASTGAKVRWNVEVSDEVNSLAVTGSHVYIGGGSPGLDGFALMTRPPSR
jgi:hypothetical protein